MYKMYYKDGTRQNLYLKDVDKTTVLGYVQNKDIKAYNNIIINWGEIKEIKCHELKDDKLTKIVDGELRTMKAANE